MVWQALCKHGATQTAVLWNAFAFHPMRSPSGWLTNRKPSGEELQAGAALLTDFLDLFRGAAVVSVGRTAEGMLRKLGCSTAASLRHPANGGAPAYRSGFADLCDRADKAPRRACMP
jgi:hypothetical protein